MKSWGLRRLKWRLALRLLEIVRVGVRLDHIARRGHHLLPVVGDLPAVALDLPVAPPPLTSFTGCRSRLSLMTRPFFSRRQTDRIT